MKPQMLLPSSLESLYCPALFQGLCIYLSGHHRHLLQMLKAGLDLIKTFPFLCQSPNLVWLPFIIQINSCNSSTDRGIRLGFIWIKKWGYSTDFQSEVYWSEILSEPDSISMGIDLCWTGVITDLPISTAPFNITDETPILRSNIIFFAVACPILGLHIAYLNNHKITDQYLS